MAQAPTPTLDQSIGTSLATPNTPTQGPKEIPTQGPQLNKSTLPAPTPLTADQQANNASIAKGGFQPSAVTGMPSPISADTLGTPAKAVTVPPPTPTTPATTSVSVPPGTTVDANGNATPIPPPKGDSSTNDTQAWIKQQLEIAGTELGTEGTVRSQAENDNQTAAKTAQATADFNAYNAAKIQQTNTIEAMRTEAGGTTTGTAERIANYQKESDANISNLAIQSQISQGNATAAQKAVDDKITNQFGPLKDRIDFLTKFASVNNNDLSDSEKFALQQKADQMKTDSEDVSKFSSDIQTNMVQNKAPASALDAIDKVTNDFTSGKITAADAKDQILKAAGAYAGDSYKAAQTAKLNADAIKEATDSKDSNVSILDGNSNPISVPTSVAPYVGTSSNGTNYVDASTLQGTATDKKKIIDEAQAAGLKVILNKNSILDLTNIKDANSKLDSVTSLLNDISQPDALARDLGGYGLTTLGALAQTNPQAAIAQSVPIVGLDVLKAISGVQGFRGNQTAIQQVQDHLPKATDTAEVVKGKVDFIRKLLNDRENAITGTPKVTGFMKSPDGTQQVDTSKLTPAQIKEAQNAGWK